MRLKKYLTIAACFTILASFHNNAEAASTWSISPSLADSPIVANLGDEIAFDLFFNVDPAEGSGYGIYATGIDLTFNFDSNELAYSMVSTPAPPPIYSIDEPKLDIVLAGWDRLAASTTANTVSFAAAAPLSATYGTNLTAGSQYHIATLYFDVTAGMAADGLSDVWLDAQTGNEGILPWAALGDIPVVMNFDGAMGADVSAVPIPGALWLLGSGLTGLVALRRKNS
ncbi:MAG: VPLPA-CTERM sorting domain-containing protein [Desulfobulbaceae bacterium]|nr:VPLPA-CTERM sorting domain-containing protein [Desulfobulbaceae bacterium]